MCPFVIGGGGRPRCLFGSRHSLPLFSRTYAHRPPHRRRAAAAPRSFFESLRACFGSTSQAPPSEATTPRPRCPPPARWRAVPPRSPRLRPPPRAPRPGMSAWVSCSTTPPSTDSPQRWRSAAAPKGGCGGRTFACLLTPHASCWHRRIHAASDRAEADATDKQTPEPLAAAARRVGAERGREAANGVLLAHEAYAMPRVHTALARRNPLASTP